MDSQDVTPFDDEIEKPAFPRATSALLAVDVRVTGQPLDPGHMGKIIKPRELVDIIELTPLNRNETILYNQLLGNAWNNIRTTDVHKVAKASLRGSHESNDRLSPLRGIGDGPLPPCSAPVANPKGLFGGQVAKTRSQP